MQGRIFEIQRFSVHDGPGIRTTVFLKGCQLHCLWCHNPESVSPEVGDVAYVPGKCIDCGACFACLQGAHGQEDGKHVFHREKCRRSGECVQRCPTRALTASGRVATAEEIVREAARDRSYYGDDGGLTLSGGEPVLQPEFVRRVLELAREDGICTALETNLAYDWERLDGIRDAVGLFLADWKESDPERHREYTGMDNLRIAENIRRLHDGGYRVLLRCPIIPGLNDREDHFRTIAEMTTRYPNLLGAELLPYHNLGINKMARFGLNGKAGSFAAASPDAATTAEWVRMVRDMGGRVVNEE